jgi:hypothetical protein
MNYYNVFFQKPLALLDDGRIVMWMQVDDSGCTYAFFRIYDPRTNTFSDGTTVADCTRVIFFAWSLLQTGQRQWRSQKILEGCAHSKQKISASHVTYNLIKNNNVNNNIIAHQICLKLAKIEIQLVG